MRKPNRLPVQSRPYLFKDTGTGAIISHDQTSYSNVLKARRKQKDQAAEIAGLKAMVEQLIQQNKG